MARVTDGRDVLDVPDTAVYALVALGWREDPSAEPAKPPVPKRRPARKKTQFAGVPTNETEPGDPEDKPVSRRRR